MGNWVRRPPVYHIDVKATRGGIRAELPVSQVEFERARELSVLMRGLRGVGMRGEIERECVGDRLGEGWGERWGSE